MNNRETKEGYNLSCEELKRLQDVQKELISEVKRICLKNNIHFNMVGGTMLGAVRHSGYIPWDDDADIGFLRAEYEKFREVCKKDLNHEKYYMQDLRDTEGYRWGYGKLRKKGTEFIRLNQEFMPYEQGIFIDLMPFDNVPDNIVLRKIHFIKCFIYRKFFWSKVGAQSEGNRFIRILYKLMSYVPMRLLVSRYQRFIDAGQKKKTKLVRILTFPTPKGVCGYERKWYTKLSKYQFDELVLPGARDYDGYLTVKYGNYMEMPPAEKRKTHPVSKIRF